MKIGNGRKCKKEIIRGMKSKGWFKYVRRTINITLYYQIVNIKEHETPKEKKRRNRKLKKKRE